MAINMNQRTGQRVAMALFLAAMAVTATSASAAQVNIAAVVGDTVITTTDVEERRDLIMATSGIPATVENQQKITPRVVQSLIDETLELQEAKAQSQNVTDEEVNKAIDSMGARGESKENLRQFITSHGLSLRSLENQIRAQLSWNKVVTRKLRRNVAVAQDEVARAQKAAAAAPGESELRIQAMEIRFTGKNGADGAHKMAEEIGLELKAGTPMASLATRYIKHPEVAYNPPLWVPEKSMPPALQQKMQPLKAGEVTPPLPGERSLQLIQLLDRAVGPKLNDTTEYALKQIVIPVPVKRDKTSLAKLRVGASALRSNPGSCDDAALPQNTVGAVAQIIRVKLTDMAPQQRSLLAHMEVGDISEPLMGPDAIRLIMVCEKVEPAAGNLPDAEGIRQQLFSEKLELEAQKHLRNLRRDAYIDIKGAN